ncbi:MAG: hypothetical protein HYX92_15235 [Chloroflexi bacterium]|nr:hypothetical protein [Chloroflexota bacterium]
MLSSKLLTAATCFSVLGLLAASCAPAAEPTRAPKTVAPSAATAKPLAPSTPKAAAPSPSPKPTAEQRRYGGILTIGIGGDPPSLDIHREETAYIYALTNPTYSGLARYDPRAWPETKVVGDLATTWELSPDGKVYTFRLAKAVKFHDGTPLTAEDVKFSLDRIRDPSLGLTKSPRRTQLAAVTSIATPDDSTVKITLSYPQASLMTMMGSFLFAVMPKRLVLEKKGDMTKTLVGSGAFKFKDYSSGIGWELAKNADYFVPGLPYLDGIKAYIIPDSFTRFAALRTRSILWYTPFPYMTMAQAETIEKTLSGQIAVKWGFHPAWYGAIFNVARAPWSDARVRQAISLAFDRKKMLATGLQGAGVVGMSPQAPGEWALPEDEITKMPGYAKPDIEGAKKLLAEAGFPNGFQNQALTRTDPANQAVGVLLKDAVAPIGVTLDLNLQETAAYFDQRDRKAYSIVAGSSGSIGTDPDILLGDFFVTGGGRNWAGYSNPQYDDLYPKQSRALDPAERKKIVWEMQRILLKDLPIAIAYWANAAYAWWKEVRDYYPPTSFHNAFSFAEVWLAN